MRHLPAIAVLTAVAAFVAHATIGTPAWAVNKCTGVDGKVSFQDAPCPGKGGTVDVKPAAGASSASALAPAAATTTMQSGPTLPKKQTEADRLNALTAASQRERRKVELDERLVPFAKGAITQALAQCDAQLSALQAKKRSANNNLAGATWEGSISSEMAAIATRCDTRARELREELTTLRKECDMLGGCRNE